MLLTLIFLSTRSAQEGQKWLFEVVVPRPLADGVCEIRSSQSFDLPADLTDDNPLGIIRASLENGCNVYNKVCAIFCRGLDYSLVR